MKVLISYYIVSELGTSICSFHSFHMVSGIYALQLSVLIVAKIVLRFGSVCCSHVQVTVLEINNIVAYVCCYKPASYINQVIVYH